MSIRSLVVNRVAIPAVAAFLSAGVTAHANLLVVNLRTEYVPLTDFGQIVISLRSQTDASFLRSTTFLIADPPPDFSMPVRVAEIDDLPTDTYRVQIDLTLPFSCDDVPPRVYPPGTIVVTPPRVVDTYVAIVRVETAYMFTAFLPRDPGFDLSAEKTVIRWDDRDRDGQVSDGDVLGYRATLTGGGDLFFFDEPRAGARLVAGTVTTTRGTISTGNNAGDTAVRVDTPGIPDDPAAVEFDVEVVAAVENQGRLWRLTDLRNVRTDDPNTPAPQDATVTPIVCSVSESCAGELKKCQSGLSDCQAARKALQEQLDTVLADPDGDAVPAVLDRCADTPKGLAVDDRGCSLAQFCGAIDARGPRGRALCRAADWRGDEPLGFPLDCRPLGARCVAR
jgi:hypothetical protein